VETPSSRIGADRIGTKILRLSAGGL